MTKNAQRLSQVVSTFGPGAMVDLPTRSVVVGGLEVWDMRSGCFATIPEPRSAARLETIPQGPERLAQTTNLSLRTPPVDRAARPAAEPHRRAGVPGMVRLRAGRNRTPPAAQSAAAVWCTGRTSTRPEAAAGSSSTTARSRTSPRSASSAPARKATCRTSTGAGWCTRASRATKPMWIEEKGTSADPADIDGGMRLREERCRCRQLFRPDAWAGVAASDRGCLIATRTAATRS